MPNLQPGRSAAQSAGSLKTGPIGKAFDELMIDKNRLRDRINDICTYINPSLRWREDGEDEYQNIQQVHQTAGTACLASMRGRISDTCWPLGENPIRFDLDCSVEESSVYTEDQISSAADFLDTARHKLWNTVLSTSANQRAFASGRGFRASSNNAIDLALVHGDVCVSFRTDYLVEVFRPDQWVMERDGQGLPLRYIIIRRIDPKTLPDETIERCNFPDGLLEKERVRDRMVNIYTNYQAEEVGGAWKWKLTEECNGEQLAEKPIVHDEARIFSCPHLLYPGDVYGRSAFEATFAKFKTLSQMKEATVNLVAIGQDVRVVIDQGSPIRARRYLGQSGDIIEGGRVVNGVAQDVGVVSINKHQELRESREEARLIEIELYKEYGVETELFPTQDRTTRLHVQEMLSRFNSKYGGQILAFVETISSQFIRAAVDIAREGKLWGETPAQIAPIIDNFFKVRITEGAAALARAGSINKTLAWAQAVATVKQNGLPEGIDETKLALNMAIDMGLDLSKAEISQLELERRRQAESNREIQQQTAIAGGQAAANAAAGAVADRLLIQ